MKKTKSIKKIRYCIALSSLLFLASSFDKFFATEIESQSHIIDNVGYINQDSLVAGCESASATMLLQFWGYEIFEENFYDKILLHKDWSFDKDGIIWGADPNSAYVGDARKKKGLNCGFGCYAPVLFDAINKVLDPTKHAVINLTGTDFNTICTNYINKGYPVITYATMGMDPPKPTTKWRISYLDKNSKLKIGDEFTWLSKEHCVLLIGHNKNTCFLNDPLQEKPKSSVPKILFKRRYEQMGKQALVIVPKDTDISCKELSAYATLN